MGKTKLLFDDFRYEVSNRIHEIEEGNENTALEVYHICNQMEKFAKEVKSEVKEIAMREIQDGYEINGFSSTVKNGSTRYDFKSVQKWVDKQKELKEIEEQSKQAYLSIQKGMQVASEDGEEIDLPTVKHTEDSISITKNK